MKETLLTKITHTVNSEIGEKWGFMLVPNIWINYLEAQLKGINPHNLGPFKKNSVAAALNFVGSEKLAKKIADDKDKQGMGIDYWYEVICSMKRALAN